MDRLPAIADRPRVLYMTHRVPYPLDKGDRIRNHHMLRHLADRARVWLVALADEPVTDAARAALEPLCERLAIVPVGKHSRWFWAGLSPLLGGSISEGAFMVPRAARIMRAWAAEAGFSAAMVSAGVLVPYLRDRRFRGVPKFVDLIDVDSQKWFDYADATHGPRSWLYRFEGRQLRDLERGLPGWAKAISLVSKHEAKVYESFAGPGTATMATCGVDHEFFRPAADRFEDLACVFVGAMDYLPNVDAATWFAREVWPRVRQLYPMAEFRIVGRKPTAAVRQLAELPGVVVTGSVADIRPYVAQSSVAVMPMRLSRGLQNKVLEALAMGKAVIAGPPALAALETSPGTHLLSASTADEWVAAICTLFESPDLRSKLGAAGRQYVLEHHDWECCLSPLLDQIALAVASEPKPNPAVCLC